MLVDDRHDLGNGLVARAADIPPGQVLGDRVDVIDTPVRISGDHAIADGLQRHLGALLFLEDPRFGALAIGDVGNRALVGDDVAILVVDGPRVLEDHDFPAVLAAQPVLEILDEALCLEAGEHALAVDGVDVQHRRSAGRLEFFGAVVAEHLD